MSLDGAKLICLNEAGEHGKQIEAKGRKFTIGYYTTSDCILLDSRAMGVHCEIQVDPFGRVLLCNLSDEYPISFNDQVITKKRPLFKSGILKILDKNYLWKFPSTYNMVYEDAAEMVDTTPKQASVPKPSGFSCPELMAAREVQKRFTVHNFAYCIRSDDESNMSTEIRAEQDLMTSTKEEIKNKSDEANESMCESTEIVALDLDRVVPADGTTLPSCTEAKEEIPKGNLISSTPNRAITWTQQKHKLVTLCEQSDMVVTSFSPRETGVRAEKSFTAVFKARTLTTPNSVYSTPKGILDGLNADESHDFIDFSTPVSSKKWQSHLATNSSMHLIDFTTPGRLRPLSPRAKSASKLIATKNITTPIVTKFTTQQLGLSTLPETSGVETPDSVASIISVESSPSIIEISDATPELASINNSSASGIEVSDATPASVSTSQPSSVKDGVHVVNKAITTGISTPKRTPQLLMKRALLTSARKQHEASLSKSASKLPNRSTTTTGNALTPSRPVPRVLPVSTSAATKTRLLTQGSDVKSSTVGKKITVDKLPKLEVASTSKAAASRRSMLSFRTGSERHSQLPLATTTPAGRHTSKLRLSAKTSPLRGVRKSFSANANSVSQISKPRMQTSLSRSTQLLARARKSLCMSGVDVKTHQSISKISGKSTNCAKPMQNTKEKDDKSVITSDVGPKQDVTVEDELNRTFTVDSEDETEVENNVNGSKSGKSDKTIVEDDKKVAVINLIDEIEKKVDDVYSDNKVADIIEEPIDIAEIKVTLPDSTNVDECEKARVRTESVEIISESFGEVLEMSTTQETADVTGNLEQNVSNDIDSEVKFIEHTESEFNDIKTDLRNGAEITISEDKDKSKCTETVSESVSVVVETKAFDKVEDESDLALTTTSTDESTETRIETEFPPEDEKLSSKKENDVYIVNKKQTDISLIENSTITLEEKKLEPDSKETTSEHEPMEIINMEKELYMKECVDIESGGSEGTADLLEQIEYVLNKSDELEQKQHLENKIEVTSNENKAQVPEVFAIDFPEEKASVETDKTEEIVAEVLASEHVVNTMETEEKENRHNIKQVEKSIEPKTPNLRGLRDLYKINENELKTPRFAGLRELMRTPKIKHNRSELENLEGISSLLKTPNIDKETPSTSNVKSITGEQSTFTPRRSARRASMSAEIATASSAYTPKRRSRRASTSATETASITFTPKRITTRRSSMDADVIPPTPDVRTPRPKRLALIEDSLKDMNAIAEEECMQEETQGNTENNQNTEVKVSPSNEIEMTVELAEDKTAEIEDEVANKKIDVICDEEIKSATTTSEIQANIGIIEESICEEIIDFTTSTETEIKIPESIAAATPTIRTVNIQAEEMEKTKAADLNVASQNEEPCSSKKSFKAEESIDNSAYNYGEEIDESEVFNLEDTTKVIDDQNETNKNNEVHSEASEIVNETVSITKNDKLAEISQKEEIENLSPVQIEVESRISSSEINEEIEKRENIIDKEDTVQFQQATEDITKMDTVKSAEVIPDIQQVEKADKETTCSSNIENVNEEKYQTIKSPSKICANDSIHTPIKNKNPELIQNEDKQFIGMREMLKTPKYCSTPHFKGLKEMMKTPKICSTPTLEGIKELLDTPKRSSSKDERLQLKDSSIFTTPSAKNVMIPNEPLSTIIDRNPESVELCNLADSTVNYAENVTTDASNIFQTTIHKKFTDNTVESPTTSTCRKSILNVNNLSSELVRKDNISKTTTSQNIPSLSFSASDIISDLPKADVQKWVDNLEAPENVCPNDLILNEEEEQNMTITEKSTENISQDPLSSLVSKKDHNTTINSEGGLVNVSMVSSMPDPLSENIAENKQNEDQMETTEVISPIKQLTEGEMSGINLLDQTNDESTLFEPLIVSDTDSNDEEDVVIVKNKDATITKENDKVVCLDDEDEVIVKNEKVVIKENDKIECVHDEGKVVIVKNEKGTITKENDKIVCLDDELEQNEIFESLVCNESEKCDKSVKKTVDLIAGEKVENNQEILNESTFKENDTDAESLLKLEFSQFDEYATVQQQRSMTPDQHRKRGKLSRKTLGAVEDLKEGTTTFEDAKLSLKAMKKLNDDTESVKMLVEENEEITEEMELVENDLQDKSISRKTEPETNEGKIQEMNEKKSSDEINLASIETRPNKEEINLVDDELKFNEEKLYSIDNEVNNEKTLTIKKTESSEEEIYSIEDEPEPNQEKIQLIKNEEIQSLETLSEKEPEKDGSFDDSNNKNVDALEGLSNLEKEHEISNGLNMEESREQINKELNQNEFSETETGNSEEVAEHNIATKLTETDSGINEEQEEEEEEANKPISREESCEKLEEEHEEPVEEEIIVKRLERNADTTIECLVETKDEFVENLPKEENKNQSEIVTTNTDKFNSTVEEDELKNNEVMEDLLNTENENTHKTEKMNKKLREEKYETPEEESTIQEESQTNGKETSIAEIFRTEIVEIESKMLIEEVTSEEEYRKEIVINEGETNVSDKDLESNDKQEDENKLTKSDETETEQILGKVIIEEIVEKKVEKSSNKELDLDNNEGITLTAEEQQNRLEIDEECEKTTTEQEMQLIELERNVEAEKLQSNDNAIENSIDAAYVVVETHSKTGDENTQSEQEMGNNVHIAEDEATEVKEENSMKGESEKSKLSAETDNSLEIEQNTLKVQEKSIKKEPTKRVASRRKKTTSESTSIDETEKPKRSNRRRAKIDEEVHDVQDDNSTIAKSVRRKRKNTEDTAEKTLPVEKEDIRIIENKKEPVVDKNIVEKESTEEEHETAELPKKKPATRRRAARGDSEKDKETPTLPTTTTRRARTRHHNDETAKQAEEETEKEDTKITQNAEVIVSEAEIVDLTSQDEVIAPLEVIKETEEDEPTKPIVKTTKASTSTRRKRQVVKEAAKETDTSTAEEHSSASVELPLATNSARKRTKRERTPATSTHDDEESIAVPAKKRMAKRGAHARADEISEEQHNTPKLPALPRRTRKASVVKDVIEMPLLQESAIESELQTSKQSRHQPRRAAAAQRHNYDESSDGEMQQQQQQPRTVAAAVISQTADILQSLIEPNTSIGGNTSTTRGGRTRKPTARVQQFLEEERAKTSTPKRRGAIISTPIAHSATPTMEISEKPEKTPAKRARKLSSSNSSAKQTAITSSTSPSAIITLPTATVTAPATTTSTRRRRGRALRVDEMANVTATAIATTPTLPAHICADDDIEAQEKAAEEESQRQNETAAKQTPVERGNKGSSRSATRRGKTTTPSMQILSITADSVTTEAELLTSQTNATPSAPSKKPTIRTRRGATIPTPEVVEVTQPTAEPTFATAEEKPKATTRRRGVKAKASTGDTITEGFETVPQQQHQQEQKEEQTPHSDTQNTEVSLSPNVTHTATKQTKRGTRRKQTENVAADNSNDASALLKGIKSTTARSTRRKAVHFDSSSANVEVTTVDSGISADVVVAAAVVSPTTSTAAKETIEVTSPPPVKRTRRTRHI